MPPKKAQSQSDLDLLLWAGDYAKADQKELLRQVMSNVSYAQFHTSIPLEAFEALVRVALLDLWGSRGRTAAELGKMFKIAPEDIEKIRRRPEYHQICEQLIQAMEAAANPQRFQELVADPKFQHRLFQRMARTALHHEDGRVGMKAAELLVDRVAPPEKAGQGGQTVIYIQHNTLKQIESTEKMLRKHGVKLVGDGDESPPHQEIRAKRIGPAKRER